MRADVYLTSHGFYESRSRAQAAIKGGKVRVNGRVIKKPGEKIEAGADVKAAQLHPFVSRGGLKLTKALSAFNVDPNGKICLDVGASTGGFTDVLLKAGAAHIYAVDVGTAQLHERLRGDARVTSMENTDARSLRALDFLQHPELIVCDASFISLCKVLTSVLSIPKVGGQLITLVKPQFEVGKAGIGKGGIVKSESDALMALSDVSAWITHQGWHVVGTIDSPIKGGSGNSEYLLYAVKQ